MIGRRRETANRRAAPASAFAALTADVRAAARGPPPGAGVLLAAMITASMAAFLILHRAAPLVGASAMGAAGIGLAVAGAGALTARLGRTDGMRRGAWLTALGAGVLTGAAGLALAGLTPPPSWDGQTYHLPAVIWLMEGWQPLRHPPPVAADHHVLAAYYPSGLWTIQAGIADLAGAFDASRAVNVLIAAAAAGAVGAWLAPVPDRGVRWAGTGLLIANPIAVVQMPTAMLDGTLYYLTLIFAVSLDRWLATRGMLWGAAALATVLVLVNTKLAGLYFSTVLAGVLFVAQLIRARRRGLGVWHRTTGGAIGVVLVAGIIGTLALGYRPYVSNVLAHGTLVHPPTDVIMAGQAPSTAAAHGHVGQLAHLVFSANAAVDAGGASRLSAPWQIPKESFQLAVDNRSGGFGPAFDIGVLLALGAMVASLARRLRATGAERDSSAWARLAVAMGACVVLFPVPWWARFVPMAWAVPLALSGAAWARGGPIPRALAGAACLAACVDVGVAVASTSERMREARPITGVVDSLAACPRPLPISRGRLWSPAHDLRHMSHLVWRRWLRAHDVPVAVKARDACPPGPALGADVHVCGRCPTAPAE